MVIVVQVLIYDYWVLGPLGGFSVRYGKHMFRVEGLRFRDNAAATGNVLLA